MGLEKEVCLEGGGFGVVGRLSDLGEVFSGMRGLLPETEALRPWLSTIRFRSSSM
jgi:hypothetical protein